MKKSFIILLAALLLCGVFACGTEKEPTTPEKSATEMPSAVAPEPVVSSVIDAPAFSEENARPLSLETDKNTGWVYNGGWQGWRWSHYHLLVYADGTACLFTPNEVFVLTENGETFSLETRLFRTADDTKPALTLPAGEVRLSTDGAAVKIEIMSDPFGVLAYDGLDSRVLKTEQEGPGETRSEVNRFYLPLEPDTEWSRWFDMGERRNAYLSMTVGADGAMTGTLRFPDGTERPCTLVGNDNGYALIDASGEKPELLFYGIKAFDVEEYRAARYELVELPLDMVCDPFGLCAVDPFSIVRRDRRDGESELLTYMLGENLDTIILSLIRDGWTDRTLEVETLNPLFEGFFAWLVKDGRTLFIHTDYDFSQPYELSNAFPDAFVLYDTDGAVLEWGGSRPLDHAIADGYKRPKGAYFYSMDGVTGAMITGEDQDAYFLDDGRIAIEFLPHEDGDGDVDFQIVKVIP